MKKILLDTNAYVKYLTGDERVLNCLGKAETVYMSVIMLGELYAGFEGGNREFENKALLERFLQKPTVEIISVSVETSEIFGHIVSILKNAGTPIPINDIWISANAVETGSVLITYDSHFQKVPGIRIWDEFRK